jgi:hypothetical protein
MKTVNNSSSFYFNKIQQFVCFSEKLSITFSKLKQKSRSIAKTHKSLTREHIEVPHSDFNELWPVATPHCCDEKPKSIRVPTASFESYARFTEFLTLS